MPLPQLSALIVDDVAAVRSVIAEILRQLGIAQVLEAADGSFTQ